MTSMRFSLAFAAALLAAPAFAQDTDQPDQAPQQAPQGNQPMKPSEMKEFGDWTVRCYPVKSQTPCEMLELRVIKKTGQRILGITLAYMPGRDQHVVQIAVPLGVSLPNGLILESDTYKSPVIKFRRCDQMGCYVEAAMTNDIVQALSHATKAQADVVTSEGKRFPLVFSLKGFNEAHAALVELTKSKGAGGSAAPAAPKP